MTEIVESEAARLSRLTTRLIRTARLEREEIRPWIELIDVADVVADSANQYTRLSAGRRISVVRDCEFERSDGRSGALAAGGKPAFGQRLQVFQPGFDGNAEHIARGRRMAVRVLSSGTPDSGSGAKQYFRAILPGRGRAARGAGIGLGLFVARKIALALGGNIELDGENPGAANGTVFRLALPVPKGIATMSPQLSSVLVVDDEPALRRS